MTTLPLPKKRKFYTSELPDVKWIKYDICRPLVSVGVGSESTFEVYAGQNFSKKIENLMTSVLDVESPLNNAVQSYQNTSSDIEDRLKKLEEREELIKTRYTAQFGKMEQSMTQFNSTKTLLDNFIEAWKKQK